ncbi:hypothetical protein [Pantoea allii]|uniref:hypothetical protein n=1 Tax=Pantoea allii TaxID=574096 RepID=UPI0024B6844C|nr:hypothetical protein [Pantoea allii]MDJ0042937.1 hypothetical protein [Pantoea allii]
MTKSVFTVHLSKSAGNEMKPFIEKIIDHDDRKMRIKAMAFDSATGSSGDNLIGYVFEFIKNKDVCYSFAAIVIAWIRSRSGRTVIIRKGDTVIEAKGLTEKELSEILSKTDSSIHID